MENRNLVSTAIARSDKRLCNHLGHQKQERDLVSAAIARLTIGFAITSAASMKLLSPRRWRRPDAGNEDADVEDAKDVEDKGSTVNSKPL
ncbi:hypothetical protein TIFTF001_018394 [Ficus carica]|uniref:Uncharacterized protein n=1 Tax=Ficus carica TaxID=3494 RepID=A0AA88A9M8_FICCA|nr:hypothetical protein TIFTF001_018394 [Ficus carica]